MAESLLQEEEYLCERRLSQTDPLLHSRYKASVFAMDRLLANYKTVFPFFTNHTFEHSEQVIRYCNLIAGQETVSRLNADEIYLLLMGAALHDVGMGISAADFSEMAPEIPGLFDFMQAHPGLRTGEYTRRFHQEFSAAFLRKYHELFEIPTEEHLYAVTQIVRGHRRMNLLDEAQFDPCFSLKNGHSVNLPYLTALVKLADELDIAADRNLLFDYSTQNEEWSAHQTMCYLCHNAIKRLAVEQDRLVLYFDAPDQAVFDEVMHTRSKVDRTFAEYNEVLRERTSFPCRIREIVFEPLH